MSRVLAFAVALLSLTAMAQADPTGIMARANTAYQNGDYATAAQLYQSLADSGIVNSAVFFNLGSAYFQAGDRGRALLNFNRAQMLAPRDAETARYLARLRGERTDIEGDETGMIEGLAALTIGILTPEELGWLALLAWSGWFFLLAVELRRGSWREAARAPLIAGAVVALIGVILFASRLWVDANRPAAVIVEERVNVLSGPGQAYLYLFALHKAAEVRIVETRDGWIRFALPDGRQGWLPAEAMERVQGHGSAMSPEGLF